MMLAGHQSLLPTQSWALSPKTSSPRLPLPAKASKLIHVRSARHLSAHKPLEASLKLRLVLTQARASFGVLLTLA